MSIVKYEIYYFATISIEKKNTVKIWSTNALY